MKVVLFCGGQGMRLREASELLPKPLVQIGYRPVLWHVMKYYAHFGINDFVLCLGYKSDTIKQYFLNYNECLTNDFVLTGGGKGLRLLNTDTEDWRITFVDTGVSTSIGGRLNAVREHLEGEEIFLANYSDGLSDFPLPSLINKFRDSDAVASMLCVKPNYSFHVVEFKENSDDQVRSIEDLSESGIRINGGFFVMRPEIFNYLETGKDLVPHALQQLSTEGKLMAHKYDGFWASMDTLKDQQRLNELYEQGQAPWEIWKGDAAAPVQLRNGRASKTFSIGKRMPR